MPNETVYSSAPALRSRQDFLSLARAELRLVPGAAWPLFVRSMQARYRQTRLRWVWLLFPGIITALVWVYLTDAGIVSLGNTKIPYVVYVLGGTFLWELFVDALNAPLLKLTAARDTLTKSQLPHETYIAAGIYEALFNFLVRLGVFAVVVAISHVSVSWTILLAPLGILTLVLMGLSIGLLLAPGGLLYRDIGQAVVVGAGIWFFLTPVVYPRPPSGLATLLVRLNPVTPALDSTRSWLTGSAGGSPLGLTIVLAISVLVLLLAWLIYRLARPHLVARI